MLGRILGLALADVNGLNVAFLPDGVSPDVAHDFVNAVNEFAETSSSDDIPKGILISDKLDEAMSTNTALQYRQDDRLAVVLGRHADIGSFSHSFTEVLGPNYPEGQSSPVDFSNLARISVQQILRDDDAIPLEDIEALQTKLSSIFAKVQELQKALGQGTTGWNAIWYSHIDRGLTNLAETLTSWIDKEQEVSLENLCFASFGLPTPSNHAPAQLSGRDLALAFTDHWNDIEACKSSSSLLDTTAKANDLEGHPMAGALWDEISTHLAILDNAAMAFVSMSARDTTFAEALAQTSEQEFASPARGLSSADIEVRTRTGHDTSIFDPGVARNNPRVIVVTDGPDGSVTSEDITLLVPTVKPVVQEQLDHSQIKIVTRPQNKVRWTGEIHINESGLELRGNIEFLANRNKFPGVPQKVTIGVEVKGQDALGGLLPSRSMTTVVYAVFPAIGGLWSFATKGGKVVGSANYAGPEIADLDDLDALEGPFNEHLPKVGTDIRILAWTDRGAVETEGSQLPELKNRTGLFLGSYILTEQVRISFGDLEVNLEIQDTRSAPRSPILAAISDMASSEPELTDAERLTVRGAYETWISKTLRSSSPTSMSPTDGLFSWALRSEADQDSSSPKYAPNRGIFAPGDAHGWLKSWPNHMSVESSFLSSIAVENFINAFEQVLDVSGFLESSTNYTPSTFSWRKLHAERHALNRYLDTYTNLIEASRKQPNPYTRMWAAYPFSVFVWDSTSGFSCRSVLISPLHPIRLAWLASVEATLGESESAAALASSVEGWNFPMFGPREQSGVQMISAPSEYGEDQLFIGWSMMLAVQPSVAAAMTSPEMAGGLRMPGGTASGLDAASVRSTMRNLRKINPHLSTLTVDLSASSESNRLETIDSVVIDQIEDWIHDRDLPLFGGARVWDSSNRLGNIPRAEVERLMDNDSKAPVSWTRYRHDAAATRFSNLRVLQDGGVSVFWDGFNPDLQSPAAGLIGSVPLRRFELSLQSSLTGHQSISSPSLVELEKGHWDAFDSALRAVERNPSNTNAPVIVSEIDGAALADERSDWTVAGESFMNPSDMARLVTSQGEMDRMMWEWKPPYLQDFEDETALERRPFVSIARVPQHLRSRLESTLDEVFEGDDSSDLVADLMGTLGSKGVGLSAMLSMGGTHVSGAIGFYLVYKLMERARSDNSLRVVLPLDACDAFLRALGEGASSNLGSARRADLLLIDLSIDGVTLSPIEIKAYGLGAIYSGGMLPTADGHEMAEPLEQLAVTEAVLENIVERAADLRKAPDSATSVLWNNGVATLIESAVRLNPLSNRDLNTAIAALDGLISGTTTLRVGTPVVAFFKHDAYGPGGKSNFQALGKRTVDGNDRQFVLFSANPEEVVGALKGEGEQGRELIDSWTRSVHQAVAVTQLQESLVEPTPEDSTTEDRPDDPGQQEAAASSPDPEVLSETNPIVEPDKPARGEVGVPSGTQGDETMTEPSPSASHTSDDSVRFSVGRSKGGRAEATFWPSNTNLNQLNIGIAGDLGTGKTQLLKSLLFNLRRQYLPHQSTPPSVLIFDYKRDFQEADFLKSVGGRVLDLYRMPVNFFDLAGTPYTPIAAVQKAGQFLGVLEKIYSGIGPKQRQKFTDAVKSLFKDANGVAPLLSEVLDRYSNNGKDVDSLTAIMSSFVDMELFSEDRSEIRPFAELLDDCTLVLAVNQLGTDDSAKNSLVTLFLNMYYQYMIESTKPKFFGDEITMRLLRSFLVIDEAVNVLQYNFPVLMRLLLEGREFGFGVVLSTQYLGHFKQGPDNYAEPLLTWFIHKVPQTTSKDLQALGFESAVAANLAPALSKLEKHWSVYRSLDHPGEIIEDIPFFKLITEEADAASNGF